MKRDFDMSVCLRMDVKHCCVALDTVSFRLALNVAFTEKLMVCHVYNSGRSLSEDVSRCRQFPNNSAFASPEPLRATDAQPQVNPSWQMGHLVPSLESSAVEVSPLALRCTR